MVAEFSFISPALLKLAACLCFGLAVTLLVIAMYRSVEGGASQSLEFGGTSMRRAEMRRRALGRSRLFVLALPAIRAMAGICGKVAPASVRKYVAEPYAKAGYPGGLEDEEVIGAAALLGVATMGFIGFSIVVLAGVDFVWLALLGFPLGFLILVQNLKSKVAWRQLQVMRALPYVLDLMVLLLKSGTSLTIALARVVDDYVDHPVGDEMGQVMAELNMGAMRIDAFRAFAARVNMPDVTALADSIVQSEELGWPLADTLERLADRLQSERILRAQATAGAAGVLVMIPSTFVMIAAVLLLLGPFLVRFLRNGFSMGMGL